MSSEVEIHHCCHGFCLGVKNNNYKKRDYDMEDAFYWWIYTRPYLVWSSATEDLFFPFEFIPIRFTPISRRFIKKVKPIQQTPSSTSQALKSVNFKTVQTMTSKPSEFYQNLSWNILKSW